LTGERLLVEALQARAGDFRRVLEPGTTLRVGRTDLADWVLPGDTFLSRVHFSLAAGAGGRHLITDDRSASGTWLNGERVTAGELRHGDWIRAGHTDFRVFFEAAGPECAERPLLSEEAETAHAALSAEPFPLFAVLDAARDAQILPLLRQSVDAYVSLYDGHQGRALERWAPHLVLFRDDSDLLQYHLAAGWGERWGIFFTSRKPLLDVRRHLRRFLLVEDGETGQELYFRFYDPAVLRVFLGAAARRQRETLFGPIERFLVEDERRAVLTFVCEGR
jgi:hypothetical protein